MNPDLDKLHPYPFEKLRQLLLGTEPPTEREHIALSIGEPGHPAPSFVAEELITHLHGLSNYPLTRGMDSLRQAISDWLLQRYSLAATELSAQAHVLPVNGTREALFAIAQCLVDRSQAALVIMPNPFYQIYEGAALLAGAEPWFCNTTADNGFLPDLDAIPVDVWQRCQLFYLCSPGNPGGAVMPLQQLQKLINLAEQYNFVILSDECYSEIYPDENQPPAGLLQAAAEMEQHDFARCLVFHSLSKRSNLPGLRSGFVAGDAQLIEKFLLYRTYHGCAMAPFVQAASSRAWQDEKHVLHNRELYRAKFDAVVDILNPVLPVQMPDAGFYLWPQTPITDTDFARGLYDSENVTVLPGSFLSRDTADGNPGRNRVRLALVAPLDECIDAAQRIKRYTEQLEHERPVL